MRKTHGFTLIETLVTTFILAVGIVAVAHLFSYSARSNFSTQQRTTAATLLYDKMEQFKSSPLTDAIWASDGFDDVTMNGTPYRRAWKIGGTLPRMVTVVVFSQKLELIRATTMVGRSF